MITNNAVKLFLILAGNVMNGPVFDHEFHDQLRHQGKHCGLKFTLLHGTQQFQAEVPVAPSLLSAD